MILYVESNFVVEWVFEQEQSPAVEELLLMAERDQLKLMIPAFALVEPIWSIENTKASKDLLSRLENLLAEISRTPNKDVQSQIIAMIAAVRGLQSDREHRLAWVTDRLLKCAALLPLQTESLRLSFQLERPLNLAPLDAIILASILEDLKNQANGQDKVFCSRDREAFAGKAALDHLQVHQCQFMSSFQDALAFAKSRTS
jgi:predicted nucleic acid-binding protein